MAEILIAYKDLPSGYVRGDPITVQDDGHDWGTDERPPTFIILEIPGVPTATFKDIVLPLSVPAMPGDDEFNAPDKEDRFLIRHRRQARFLIDDLLADIQGEIDMGRIRETFAVIRPHLRALTYSRASDTIKVSSNQAI